MLSSSLSCPRAIVIIFVVGLRSRVMLVTLVASGAANPGLFVLHPDSSQPLPDPGAINLRAKPPGISTEFPLSMMMLSAVTSLQVLHAPKEANTGQVQFPVWHVTSTALVRFALANMPR